MTGVCGAKRTVNLAVGSKFSCLLVIELAVWALKVPTPFSHQSISTGETGVPSWSVSTMPGVTATNIGRTT